MQTIKCDVAVVGGGIIGICCALRLRAAGHDVVLVEQNEPASGASRGNAGALAFAEILPLASPRIIRKAIGWFFDPLGPLSVPPAYFASIAPWLWRLWRASWPENYYRNVSAQVALMQLAEPEMAAMIAGAGLGGHLHTDGVLEVFEGPASFANAQLSARQRSKYGIESQVLEGADLAAAQPGLAPRFTHGMLVSHWQTVGDPFAFAQALAQHAQDLGVRLVAQKALQMVPREGGAGVRLYNGDRISARKVVICAGAWSHQLSRQLGDVIPLETERGYNTTLAPDAIDLPRQITFVDHGFVVSPLRCGVRVGGAVELAGLERAPNYRRSQNMLDKAKKFLPALRTEGGEQWMGFRPSLPDSLPVIGPASKHPDFIYAFGHGHLGLTQSAATARLVCELVAGQTPAIDLRPYRAQRFSKTNTPK